MSSSAQAIVLAPQFHSTHSSPRCSRAAPSRSSSTSIPNRLCERQRLVIGDEARPHHHVVGGLGHLRGAHAARVDDVGRVTSQHRPEPLHHVRSPHRRTTAACPRRPRGRRGRRLHPPDARRTAGPRPPAHCTVRGCTVDSTATIGGARRIFLEQARRPTSSSRIC